MEKKSTDLNEPVLIIHKRRGDCTESNHVCVRHRISIIIDIYLKSAAHAFQTPNGSIKTISSLEFVFQFKFSIYRPCQHSVVMKYMSNPF